MSPTPHPPRAAWIAWAAVCVIWGTTFLAIKVALDTIPPFLLGGLRYVVAGTVLAAFLVARRRALPPVAHWPRLAGLGILMLGFGNGGVVWAEQYLASGLTAVVIATTPFWMIGVDTTLPGGDRLRARQVVGLLVGFSGIVLLVWPSLAVSGGRTAEVLMGIGALQLACAGWAVASGFTRRKVVAADVLGAAALQMVFGGVFMLLVGTVTGEWSALRFSLPAAGALAYLVVAGSLVAFAAYSYALRHLPVAVVSLHNYINPVIAVALGTLLLGEPFRPSMLVAGAVIALGILIVRPAGRPGSRPRRRPTLPRLSVASSGGGRS
ncbi:MAG: EamA family transporter [Vicinamibacterales bacterium]